MTYDLIDTHCHLDFPDFDLDRDEVVRRAEAAGINYLVNIGSSLQGSRKAVELSGRYKNIYAAVGIHPHDAKSFNADTLIELQKLARQEKVVAIGETGLDYYKNYSPQDEQKKLFISLIKLAKDAGLPLVIHSRQAQAETLNILRSSSPLAAVVHCFSGDSGFLKECLDSGFLVSFTCNITYKKAENLRQLVKITPLDKLLLETDAPFLPPEGLRGKRCEPAYIKELAEEVARIKGITLEEVAKETTNNAKKIFNIK